MTAPAETFQPEPESVTAQISGIQPGFSFTPGQEHKESYAPPAGMLVPGLVEDDPIPNPVPAPEVQTVPEPQAIPKPTTPDSLGPIRGETYAQREIRVAKILAQKAAKQ